MKWTRVVSIVFSLFSLLWKVNHPAAINSSTCINITAAAEITVIGGGHDIPEFFMISYFVLLCYVEAMILG